MRTTVPDTEPALWGFPFLVTLSIFPWREQREQELEQTGVFVAPVWRETVMCPQVTVRTLQIYPPYKRRKAKSRA